MQALLLQLQVQEPGVQEQLSRAQLINAIADMHQGDTYLELQVHELAIVI